MIWLVLVLGAVAAGRLTGQGDAEANFRAVTACAGEHVLVALVGVSLGLYGRDRIRLRRAYPSPTLCYCGKLLMAAAVALTATLLFSPVQWPLSWLTWFSVGGAGGAAVWIGNLPMRV